MPSLKFAEKRDRILTGLRELCAEQEGTGRAYTATEIAARCSCDKTNIEQIERKACETLAKRLRPVAKELGLPVKPKPSRR